MYISRFPKLAVSQTTFIISINSEIQRFQGDKYENNICKNANHRMSYVYTIITVK